MGYFPVPYSSLHLPRLRPAEGGAVTEPERCTCGHFHVGFCGQPTEWMKCEMLLDGTFSELKPALCQCPAHNPPKEGP